MPLRSKLFQNDRRLEACLVDDKAHVVPGAVGDHVAKIQTALLMIDGSKIDQPDRNGKRYGRSTALAVLSFKTTRGIVNRTYQTQPDDIVGKMTISALDEEMVALENQPDDDVDEVCCNGDPADAALTHMVCHHLTQVDEGQLRNPGLFQVRNARSFAGGNAQGFASVSFLSHFRPLTGPQKAIAAPVFGTSIDFTFVFLSDFKGASGRAFTVAAGPFIVMNCGSFTPSSGTLIHELTHVWQSQHHSINTAYIANSVSSQALAVTENEALALIDPTLKGDPKFPDQFPRSPYACITGRPFSEYAAEQIAKQVERNFLAAAGSAVALATAPIVAHIKAAATGVDADNVTGLKTARTEDKRTAGVLF
jgi:hypothetical protein